MTNLLADHYAVVILVGNTNRVVAGTAPVALDCTGFGVVCRVYAVGAGVITPPTSKGITEVAALAASVVIFISVYPEAGSRSVIGARAVRVKSHNAHSVPFCEATVTGNRVPKAGWHNGHIRPTPGTLHIR